MVYNMRFSALPIILILLIPASYVVTASIAVAQSSTISPHSIVNQSDLLMFNEVKSEISLGEMGRIRLADSYLISSKVGNLLNIKIYLPQGASNISAHDAMGSLKVTGEVSGTAYTNVTITLRTPLKEGEAARFTTTYQLPWNEYIDQSSGFDFSLAYTFVERFNMSIGKLTVFVELPEGANFVSSSENPLDIQKGLIQETVTFIRHNISSYEDFSFTLSYRYFIFWASFRPTLWVGVFLAIVYTITFFRHAPEEPVPEIPVPPETLRRFVSTYEQRVRVQSELESLEQQRRRISRSRYRARRKSLEGRLSVLSRDLTNLNKEIRTIGPRYADVIRRIEVSETELEGLEVEIQRVENRYRRGELSSEAYHKLLEEYRRRSERVKVALDGLILRLREEIR
jgi:hypothetical protein